VGTGSASSPCVVGTELEDSESDESELEPDSELEASLLLIEIFS
jgi:hypothetical protein